MNRGWLRAFGIGAWANSAWDFNAYFIRGGIIPYLHSWLALIPMFAIFIAYPTVGLLLLFGRVPSTTQIPKGLDSIETDLETPLETGLKQ